MPKGLIRGLALADPVCGKTVSVNDTPECLKRILEVDFDVGDEKVAFRPPSVLFSDLLKPVEADEIDMNSTLKANWVGDRAKNYMRPSSWGSNGHGNRNVFENEYFQFRNEEARFFFESLFNLVKVSTPGVELCRNNLFHGHCVFDVVNGKGDLRIVFHSFEYPSDLEAFKAQCAMALEPGKPSFTAAGNAQMFLRNAIYSLRDGNLYIPDYNNYQHFDNLPIYGAIVNFPQGFGPVCIVEQKNVGDEFVALNFFPNENAGLFVKR